LVKLKDSEAAAVRAEGLDRRLACLDELAASTSKTKSSNDTELEKLKTCCSFVFHSIYGQ
jgi:hypothetical protein